MSSIPMDDTTTSTAVLGLSIEPLSQILPQLASLGTSTSASNTSIRDPIVLADKIVKNMINYISSFVGGVVLTPDLVVPMKLVQQWYESFQGKLRAGGTGFLESSE
jgi:protein Hikeshi